jgi:queuine tRNA-ribosyltransferase
MSAWFVFCSSSEACGLHHADDADMLACSCASVGLSLEPPPPAHTFPPYTPRDYFKFEVTHESKKPGSRARLGRIHTPHGIIDTPGFVPVGTSAALKGVTDEQAMAAGVQLMFCNTYHLMVHPGSEVVAAGGGLHRYMGRSGPIITDSGGFQVFSLAPKTDADGPELKARSKSGNQATLTSVNEKGVKFRSYFDSTEIVLTPESSVLAQKDLGGDIIIPLDELPPYHITRERLEQSVALAPLDGPGPDPGPDLSPDLNLTTDGRGPDPGPDLSPNLNLTTDPQLKPNQVALSHRWMARSLRQHLSDPREQAMYAVVHGGTDLELRHASAEYLSSLPFDGFALGGSLGKDRDEMLQMLGQLMPALPREKPNHLLGIADEASVRGAVALGVDTFDSCLPTR